MTHGDIVEFIYTNSKSKYFVRIDDFFPPVVNTNDTGGIESRCHFIKTADGWHKGNIGYFPFAKCKSIKLCINKKILKKFR